MKKIISKVMGAIAIGTVLFTLQPAAAQCCPQPDPCCNPCNDWCNMCGDWEIGAHALYWTPVACQFTYVVRNPDTVQGQVTRGSASSVKCSADWGFRVFGQYQSDCSFLNLSYQWFQSKSAASRTDTFLQAPLIILGVVPELSRVNAHQRIEYQNVDLRWGKYLHRSCGCNFSLFGNVKWIDLSVRQSYSQKWQVVDEDAPFLDFEATRKAELQGAALGVGAAANLDLWCSFGMFGDANILGVIAERSTKNVRDRLLADNALSNGENVRYPSDTCINPEVNFRIGVDYCYTCGCWTFVGELGYEVDYFWDAVALPAVPSSTPTITSADWILECQNIGFSGLFFGGKILF